MCKRKIIRKRQIKLQTFKSTNYCIEQRQKRWQERTLPFKERAGYRNVLGTNRWCCSAASAPYFGGKLGPGFLPTIFLYVCRNDWCRILFKVAFFLVHVFPEIALQLAWSKNSHVTRSCRSDIDVQFCTPESLE